MPRAQVRWEDISEICCLVAFLAGKVSLSTVSQLPAIPSEVGAAKNTYRQSGNDQYFDQIMIIDGILFRSQ